MGDAGGDGGGAVFDEKIGGMAREKDTEAVDNIWCPAGWQDLADEGVWQKVFYPYGVYKF